MFGNYFNMFILCFVIASSFALIYWNFTIQLEASTHQETYTAELHEAILLCIEGQKLVDSDPFFAWNKITEGRARIKLLSKLAGGDAVLSQICATNVPNIINLTFFAEQQIRKKLPLNWSPLEQELVNKT